MPSGSSKSNSCNVSESNKTAALKFGGLIPPIRSLAIVALLVATIVALQICNARLDLVPIVDAAHANVMSLGLGSIAALVVGTWFLFFSGYPRVARAAVAILATGIVAVLLVVFRIDHVSGNLVPRLSFRWSPKPDQVLVLPSADRQIVDLHTTTNNDYPQFLGPNRNARISQIKLVKDWRRNAPKRLWRQDIGAGWSAFSAVNGFAVTMEQRGADELVTCYDLLTGTLKWFHAVESRHETIMGGVGPRSTPTIHEGKVYALGATGLLRCLDGTDGRELWTKDLLKQSGIQSPKLDVQEVAWGRSASPLIVDRWVVVPAGGPRGGPFVSLVAFDKETGQLAWEGGHEQVSYSSPSLATLGGRRQVLIVNESSLSGHAVDDASAVGSVSWKYDWPGDSSGSASASQAVALPGDRVFVSKGYGEGAVLLQLMWDNENHCSISEVWRDRSVLKTKLTNVVIRDGYVYGLSDGILECVELETGKRKWKRGRYGHGQIVLVGDVLLVLAESGDLVMVQPTPERPIELSSFAAIAGTTWNNPCLYGCYLLVRNAQEAACYELPVEGTTE